MIFVWMLLLLDYVSLLQSYLYSFIFFMESQFSVVHPIERHFKIGFVCFLPREPSGRCAYNTYFIQKEHCFGSVRMSLSSLYVRFSSSFILLLGYIALECCITLSDSMLPYILKHIAHLYVLFNIFCRCCFVKITFSLPSLFSAFQYLCRVVDSVVFCRWISFCFVCGPF